MRNKLLLIIAEASHSQPRISALSFHLKKYGWNSIIISYNVFNIDVNHESKLETNITRILGSHFNYKLVGGFQKNFKKIFPFIPSSTIEKISKLIKSFLYFPDAYFWWIPLIYLKFLKLEKKHKFDAILSSSSPVSTHIAAKFISIKYRIPWVADLRDLWSDNHDYKFISVRKKLDTYLEHKTLRKANAIVTVNETWAKFLSYKFPNKVFTVENACVFPTRYYSSQINRTNIQLTSTGPIYEPENSLPNLIEAIKRWNFSQEKKVFLDLYGPIDDETTKIISYSGLANIYVFIRGIVSRDESWARQCEATALVLFSWNTNYITKGHIPLRTYEYAATNLPVIGINFDNATTPIGKIVKNIRNVTTIEDFLTEFRSIQNNKTLERKETSVNIEITYEKRAVEYSKLLNQIIA